MEKINKKNKILIAVPYINNIEMTAQLLKSIKTSYDHAILLIDNGSSPQTTQLLQETQKRHRTYAVQHNYTPYIPTRLRPASTT